MADTFSNDLRLRLQESGSNAGTWGDLLNGTITNIASALGQGSEAIPNASSHTITLADGTADEARSLYLKCTGGGQACTVTLGPNTISKVWIIDNATSYTLTFSQGSGANVAIAAGAVKVIATDGAGSGAAVVDTLDGLEGSLSTLAVSGALTVDTNTLVVDATNNRVGIGVSAPSSVLEVSGALTVTRSDVANDRSTISNEGGLFVISAATGGGGGTYPMLFKTASTERMRINASGRVSINTTSATELLNVAHTSGNGAGVEFAGNGNTIGSTSAFYGQGSNNDAYVWNRANSTVLFGTNNTERMRINATGRVGISTTDPKSSLEVKGTFGAPATSGFAAGFISRFSQSSGVGCLDFGFGDAYSWLQSRASNNYGINYNLALQPNGGNVGIGTSNPDTTLHLQTPSGTKSEINFAQTAVTNYRIGVPASTDALVFTYGASTERMRIDASGSLMVGGTAAGTVSGNNAMITVRRDSGNCGISYQSGTAATDQWETYSNLGARFYIENTSTSNGAYLVYNSSSGWNNVSDERWKTDWTSLEDSSSKIAALNVGKYHMLNNSKESIEGAKWDYGVKAQELLEVIPDAVDVPENSEDKYGVVPNIVFWHAVKAIQEQQATIEALTQRIETLENN